MSMKVTGLNGQEWEIKRSPIALNLKIKFFSIAYVLIAIFAILILLLPFNFLDYNFTLWGTVIIFITIIMYAASLWFLKISWKHTHYSITEHGIAVSHGVGKFGEEVYRLESIISARVKQSYLGNHFGYGDIIIDIPKLQNQPDVILHDVEQPGVVLQTFREKLQIASETNGSNTSMIM